jgi:hypothetical protein
MTQAAPEGTRRRDREAARDQVANGDVRPPTLSPDQVLALSGRAGRSAGAALASDPAIQAGFNPSGPARAAGTTGARDPKGGPQQGKDRGNPGIGGR